MRSSNADRDASSSEATPRRAKGAAKGQAAGDAPGLEAARTAFVEAMRRETPGTDLPRYLAVLDALLAWSAAHADRVVFRAPTRRTDVLRFDDARAQSPLWSVQGVRDGAPSLEIHLATSRPSRAEQRAEAMRILNAHSRGMLEEGDRLRIGFGALKNATALADVLALLDRLLQDDAPPAPAAG